MFTIFNVNKLALFTKLCDIHADEFIWVPPPFRYTASSSKSAENYGNNKTS